MKRVRDALIVVLITFALAELVARVATKDSVNGMPAITKYALLPHRPAPERIQSWLEATKNASYIVSDPELGWTIKKDGSAKNPNDTTYESNAQGARAPKDVVYAPEAPPGKVRIVAVGDSFCHSDEVNYPDTWEAILEGLSKDLEVINFGGPGYGTDQAYLRFKRDGAPLKPQIALITIVPDNLVRILNITRYYLDPAGAFLTKPRFMLENNALRLVGQPVAQGEELVKMISEPENAPQMKNERWWYPEETTPAWYHHIRVINVALTYKSYKRKSDEKWAIFRNEDPSGNQLAVAIIQAFAADAKKIGAIPVVLLIPMTDMVGQNYDPDQLPIRKALVAAGLDVLDPGKAMIFASARHGLDSLKLPSNHYGPAGNRVIAEAIEPQLRPFIEKALAARTATTAAN